MIKQGTTENFKTLEDILEKSSKYLKKKLAKYLGELFEIA